MIELAEENNEKHEKYDFTELEEVIRRWAALTGHENDQDWYRKMKEMYE
jgi:hypothetical protein